MAEVKIEHETYSASASGFSLLQPLTVEVTVSEGIIETIEVTDNAETYPFLQAEQDKLIPRSLIINPSKWMQLSDVLSQVQVSN